MTFFAYAGYEDVAYADSNVAVIVGYAKPTSTEYQSLFIRSADGGATWTLIDHDYFYPAHAYGFGVTSKKIAQLDIALTVCKAVPHLLIDFFTYISVTGKRPEAAEWVEQIRENAAWLI